MSHAKKQIQSIALFSCGAPVVDANQNVIGVVRLKQGVGNLGVAIAIENLQQIWPDMPSGLFVTGRVGAFRRNSVPLFHQSGNLATPENSETPTTQSVAPQPLVNSPDQNSNNVTPVPPISPTPAAKAQQTYAQSATYTPNADPASPQERQNIPPKPPVHPHPRKKLLLALIATLLVILGGTLLYTNVIYPPIKKDADATATASVEEAISTAAAHATSTAINATATADIQATSVARAEAGAPYGGTLSIDDHMYSPGSTFDWQTGNDSFRDQCNFENNGYHVLGTCNARSNSNFIPPKFALEIDLTTRQSCGIISLQFDDSNHSPWLGICQNGDYILIDADEQRGSASSMHTGTGQTNLIDIVADGSKITLYINHVEITSISASATQTGSLVLGGLDADVALLSSSGAIDSPSDYREVVYTNALLWSL